MIPENSCYSIEFIQETLVRIKLNNRAEKEASPGRAFSLALGQGLAEVRVGAEVERRLALLVLDVQVGPVGS